MVFEFGSKRNLKLRHYDGFLYAFTKAPSTESSRDP